MSFITKLDILTEKESEEAKLDFNGYYDPNKKKKVYPKVIIEITLDRLKLTIVEKNDRNKEWEPVLNKRVRLSKETSIHDEIHELYKEFKQKKEIENYWADQLKTGKVIEILDADENID